MQGQQRFDSTHKLARYRLNIHYVVSESKLRVFRGFKGKCPAIAPQRIWQSYVIYIKLLYLLLILSRNKM